MLKKSKSLTLLSIINCKCQLFFIILIVYYLIVVIIVKPFYVVHRYMHRWNKSGFSYFAKGLQFLESINREQLPVTFFLRKTYIAHFIVWNIKYRHLKLRRKQKLTKPTTSPQRWNPSEIISVIHRFIEPPK
jgi:hypothetical protein